MPIEIKHCYPNLYLADGWKRYVLPDGWFHDTSEDKMPDEGISATGRGEVRPAPEEELER